nr:cytochrome c [Quercus suber]
MAVNWEEKTLYDYLLNPKKNGRGEAPLSRLGRDEAPLSWAPTSGLDEKKRLRFEVVGAPGSDCLWVRQALTVCGLRRRCGINDLRVLFRDLRVLFRDADREEAPNDMKHQHSNSILEVQKSGSTFRGHKLDVVLAAAGNAIAAGKVAARKRLGSSTSVASCKLA